MRCSNESAVGRGRTAQKQCRTPKVSVGKVKKSIVAIDSRWFLRKASRQRAGSGALLERLTQRDTVRSEVLNPSLSCEPQSTTPLIL